MSADGKRVAIGAPGNDDNGNSAGHVRVYDELGGFWTKAGFDIGEDIDSRSGWSIAMFIRNGEIIK